MKTMFKPMKPLKIGLLPAEPFAAGRIYRDEPIKDTIVTGKDDGPACSVEQTRDYQENWDKILPPKVVKQLKRTGDIMHGSYSTNMQMPAEYHRQPHDIDVWSKKPSLRANQMENTIDKCVGCDIAHVESQTMGKAPPKLQTLGPPPKRKAVPKNSFKRYTVVTEPKNDVDVDYSTLPTDRPLEIRELNGVRHETLNSALKRAYGLQYRPMRAGRAREDIRRIESYVASKKKKQNAEWKEVNLRF